MCQTIIKKKSEVGLPESYLLYQVFQFLKTAIFLFKSKYCQISWIAC
jgi:hypothetical protein